MKSSRSSKDHIPPWTYGLAALVGGLALCGWAGAWRSAWVAVPAGVYTLGSPEAPRAPGRRAVTVSAYEVHRTEVTVGDFVRYLNRASPEPVFESPQITLRRGRYRALVPRRLPVAFVSYAQARDYAAWRDGRARHRHVRLPTADEWEIAARGGTPGVRYPWGWAAPEGRAQFDADGPARVGLHPPNTLGLFDMAGNVAEWCRPDAPDADRAPALGGSWAERHPDLLRVFHRPHFPLDYRDADVGLRLVRER